MAMKFVEQVLHRLDCFLDMPGDGSGGGASTDAGSGATNDGAAGKSANTNDSGKSTSTSDQGSTPGAASAATRNVDDERSRGLLADLQKERKARQEWERRATEHQTALALEQKRVRALSGVEPRSAEDADIEQVRKRLESLYPALGKLTDEKLDRLLSVADRADSLEESNLAGWKRHGSQMLEQVVDGVAKQVGGTLSERQTLRLKKAYIAEAEENPEFLARHEAGDPKLIAEFVKNWIDDWFEPARRRVLTNEVDRQRKVPSARDRSILTTGGKKIDYNDPKAFEEALVGSFREHGGEFGRS